MKNKKEIINISKFQENNRERLVENANTCISCGDIIPEGMLCCMACEKGMKRARCVICDAPLENDNSICTRCRNMFLRSKNTDQN